MNDIVYVNINFLLAFLSIGQRNAYYSMPWIIVVVDKIHEPCLILCGSYPCYQFVPFQGEEGSCVVHVETPCYGVMGGTNPLDWFPPSIQSLFRSSSGRSVLSEVTL